MVIKQLVVNVYDIEIFPNCFHTTIRDTETDIYYKFEISNRKNQLQELVEYFRKDKIYFCGYNNHHYDDLIINYLIEYYNVLKYYNSLKICKSLYNMSQIIIGDENIERVKHWKYLTLFKSIDLLEMLFSSKLRIGLKEMQMSMQYRNVQEYDGDFESPILDEDIDKMISYNINDVDSTTELLNRCKEDIEIRLYIEQKYNLDCLSMDSVKFGETILENEYCKRTGISHSVLKNMRSPMDKIPLKDVIFPFIQFSNPILQDVLNDIKKQIVSSKERKGYEKKFVLSNVCYSVGVGGIHSINSPEVFIPNADEYIGHADVTSMYPSLLIKYKLTPRHLGKDFLDIYSQFYIDRINAKRSGQKLESTVLKLTLNSVTGKMQQEVSWMYDPFNVFKIRMNGQMILFMLIDRLIRLNCKIVQVNTDGVMYVAKKENQELIQDAIHDVENITKLSFEVGHYEAFYQYAVNDYFGVLEGYGISHNQKLIEKKGMFITETKLGKGLAPTIIPKAVINYFINNIPIEETIKNCNEIKDFLMGQRVSKEFKVEHNGKQIRRINRFYASTNGYYIYKYKEKSADEKQYFNMLTKSGVTLLNTFDDTPISMRNINYVYYIREARKIINDLKTVELSLFD